MYDLSHWSHIKGLMSVWVSLCVFKVPFCLKDLSHTSHVKGFSPVWVYSWVFSLLELMNDLSHSLHWIGFSFIWLHECRLSLPLLLNALWHSKQVKCFSPPGVMICYFWIIKDRYVYYLCSFFSKLFNTIETFLFLLMLLSLQYPKQIVSVLRRNIAIFCRISLIES